MVAEDIETARYHEETGEALNDAARRIVASATLGGTAPTAAGAFSLGSLSSPPLPSDTVLVGQAGAQGLLDDVPAVSIDAGKWKYVAITLTAPGETPKVSNVTLTLLSAAPLDGRGAVLEGVLGVCCSRDSCLRCSPVHLQLAERPGERECSAWCAVWRRCHSTATCSRRRWRR
jgi:hypothetical protein